MKEQTLHINWVACQGRGHCIELLEEQLCADEWGYPYSPQGSDIPIPAEQRALKQHKERTRPPP